MHKEHDSIERDGSGKEGCDMGLFGGKKEEKSYIVIDPYTEEVVAGCTTKETKQIAHVQAKAQFVECSSYELQKYREENVLPDDIAYRKRLGIKELK